jgi:hypothetical protein
MRTSKLSSLDIRAPVRVLIRPAARPGMLCSPNIASTGNRSKRPSATRLRAQPVLLGGLEDEVDRATEAPSPASTWPAPSTMAMCPSWPQACTPSPGPVRQGTALGQRQPVHVGAQPDRPATGGRRAPPADRGHQAGAADAPRDVQAHRRQLGGQVVARAVLG